jgi:hypothetical protein
LNAPERRLNHQCQQFRQHYVSAAPLARTRANRNTSRGCCRVRINQFRILFQRPRGGRTSSTIEQGSVSIPGNDLQIPRLFSSSLPVQSGSSSFDGERRAAHNG